MLCIATVALAQEMPWPAFPPIPGGEGGGGGLPGGPPVGKLLERHRQRRAQ